MPELPEVETVARALALALAGRTVKKARFIGKMRVPFDARQATAALKGRRFTGVRRRAKYLVMDFDCERVLLAHLGMTGFFHIDASSAPLDKHDRMLLELDDGEELRYSDARRFGFVQLCSCSGGCYPEQISHLGAEPLDRAFRGKTLFERAAKRKTPLKVFIMDQSIVVGVGNIYASEALFAAGLDPRRPAGSLSLDEWTRLTAEIKAVLRRALKSGGSTIRNYRSVDGTEGGFQRVLRVYGRAGDACPRCGRGLTSIRQGGRSTFFCEKCQK